LSTATNPRRRVLTSTDRRTRSRINTERTARRARADAALINQWLAEQAERRESPSRPTRAAA
jgi:hypothetical protein